MQKYFQITEFQKRTLITLRLYWTTKNFQYTLYFILGLQDEGSSGPVDVSRSLRAGQGDGEVVAPAGKNNFKDLFDMFLPFIRVCTFAWIIYCLLYFYLLYLYFLVILVLLHLLDKS